MNSARVKDLKKARLATMFVLKTLGQTAKEVVIDEIPEEWTRFPNTENEWWRRLKTIGDDKSGCSYKAENGGVFGHHVHNNNNETIIVKEGAVKVYTPNYTRLIKKGEKFTIKKGVEHFCEFINHNQKGIILFDLVWTPAFIKGWEANFIEST